MRPKRYHELTSALTLAIQSGNDEQRGAALWHLGVAYALLGKPEESLRQHQESLDIDKRVGLKSGMVDNLKSIAALHDDRGESSIALKSYTDALALAREIGDRQRIGDVLLDLGTFYLARGRYDQALTPLKEALQAQREVHNRPYEAAAPTTSETSTPPRATSTMRGRTTKARWRFASGWTFRVLRPRRSTTWARSR